MDEKIKCEMKDSLRSFYFNTVKSALPNLNNRRKDRLMAIFYILFYIIVVVIGLTFMVEVSLEDVEFCEKYKVYSNNQIEARYILTTAFMQRFKDLKTAFKAKYMRAGFKDGKIVMVLNVEHDLFSMGSILKDTDNKTFTKLFDEIISVLELTEELKLNQNLGL